jgi:hypothetical protein
VEAQRRKPMVAPGQGYCRCRPHSRLLFSISSGRAARLPYIREGLSWRKKQEGQEGRNCGRTGAPIPSMRLLTSPLSGWPSINARERASFPAWIAQAARTAPLIGQPSTGRPPNLANQGFPTPAFPSGARRPRAGGAFMPKHASEVHGRARVGFIAAVGPLRGCSLSLTPSISSGRAARLPYIREGLSWRKKQEGQEGRNCERTGAPIPSMRLLPSPLPPGWPSISARERASSAAWTAQAARTAPLIGQPPNLANQGFPTSCIPLRGAVIANRRGFHAETRKRSPWPRSGRVYCRCRPHSRLLFIADPVDLIWKSGAP